MLGLFKNIKLTIAVPAALLLAVIAVLIICGHSPKKYNLDCDKYVDISKYTEIKYDKKAIEERGDKPADAVWRTLLQYVEAEELPAAQLEYEKERLLMTHRQSAKQLDLEWKDYLKQIELTDEELDERLESAAKATVKEKLVCYAIAKKENIKLPGKEYRDGLRKIPEAQGCSKEEFEEFCGMSLEEYGELHDLRFNLLLDKVKAKVLEYAEA